MEISGLWPAGNAAFGASLLTNEPVQIGGLPPPPRDEYAAGNASIAADHGSLKIPGSVAHRSVTKKIEEIAGNPALTDKQKRAAINDLRKQLGLSKGDMKKFYTKPLERKAALEGDETKRKLYASMYKPGGCVKKVFKGIGKGFATVGKVALGVASAVFNPMSLIPIVGQIPMVGKIVNTVSGAVSKAKSVVDGAVDKVSGWVDRGMGYFNRGVDLYRKASELPKRWIDEAKGIFYGE